MAIAHLTGKGVISESQESYEYLGATQPLPPSMTSPSVVMVPSYQYHLQDIDMIPATVSQIQPIVYNLGGLYTVVWPVSIGYFMNDYFYDSYNCGYYCPISTGADHAVAIIGWDNSYPASNFVYTSRLAREKQLGSKLGQRGTLKLFLL